MARAASKSHEASAPSSSRSSLNSCIIVDTASRASNSTRPTSVSSINSQDWPAVPTTTIVPPKSLQPKAGSLESFGFTSTSTRLTKSRSSPALTAPKPRLPRNTPSRSSETWLESPSEEADRHSKESNSTSRTTFVVEQARPRTATTRRRSSRVSRESPSGSISARHSILAGFPIPPIPDQSTHQSSSRRHSRNNSLSTSKKIDTNNSPRKDQEHASGHEIPLVVEDLQLAATKRKPTVVRKMVDAVAAKASSLGKRSRDVFERGVEKGKETLQHLDCRKSSRVQALANRDETPATMPPPSKKLKRSAASAPQSSPAKTLSSPRKQVKEKKTWLRQGLYVGQDRHFDPKLTGSQNRAKRLSIQAGYAVPQENKSLPLPMFFGEDLLEIGRDFRLPFDIYNPLPTGQPKPDEWKKTQSNRVIGDAVYTVKEWSKYKKMPSSRCTCSELSGCGENCLNRTMLYECDDNNCTLGDFCNNRAFADLRERCKTGRKYDIGVEVVATNGKGFGIRACRTFEPNQIIVEYAGEIIDQEECNRRMQEDYTNARCYYLMEFDNNMIIDATRGTIARFVNHSCEPNCEMIKWTVAGKPRMALFAGDGGIMTGEELTYDYNFDNFNEDNTTPCACGTPTCRGVLGRKPTEQEAKKQKKTLMAAAAAATKAKLEAVMSGGDNKLKKKKKPRHKGWVYFDADGNEIEEPEPEVEDVIKGRKRKSDGLVEEDLIGHGQRKRSLSIKSRRGVVFA